MHHRKMWTLTVICILGISLLIPSGCQGSPMFADYDQVQAESESKLPAVESLSSESNDTNEESDDNSLTTTVTPLNNELIISGVIFEIGVLEDENLENSTSNVQATTTTDSEET